MFFIWPSRFFCCLVLPRRGIVRVPKQRGRPRLLPNNLSSVLVHARFLSYCRISTMN